ncbi:hypothetical protein ACWD6R_21440 [Streptomyces sp. NPDC005151]
MGGKRGTRHALFTTESQWRALLDRGGFDTADIHRGARAALIEAVPR